MRGFSASLAGLSVRGSRVLGGASGLASWVVLLGGIGGMDGRWWVVVVQGWGYVEGRWVLR